MFCNPILSPKINLQGQGFWEKFQKMTGLADNTFRPFALPSFPPGRQQSLCLHKEGSHRLKVKEQVQKEPESLVESRAISGHFA